MPPRFHAFGHHCTAHLRLEVAALLVATSTGVGCGTPDRANDAPRGDSNDAGAEDSGTMETSFEIDCMPDAGAAFAPCGSPIRLAPGVDTAFPHLVWTGAQYGLAFTANFPASHEVRFARLDASGSVIGANAVVAGGADVSATPVALGWSGDQYGIAWVDSRDGNPEIYFARRDANGGALGSDVRVTSAIGSSILPSLVAHAAGFALAWQDDRTGTGDNEIYFARLDENGVKIGDDTLVTSLDGAISQEPSIAWTGAEYGIAWYDKRDGNDYEIYFTRMDSSGAELGDDLRLTDSVGISSSPHLISVPGGYTLCWDDKRDGNMEIYCGKLDAKGIWTDAPHRITQTLGSSLFPSVAFTGAGFAVAWDDPTCGMYDVYFSALDSRTAKLGSTLAITKQGAAHPSLVWDGSGLAAAWHDFRHGDEEVLFCRLFR